MYERVCAWEWVYIIPSLVNSLVKPEEYDVLTQKRVYVNGFTKLWSLVNVGKMQEKWGKSLVNPWNISIPRIH